MFLEFVESAYGLLNEVLNLRYHLPYYDYVPSINIPWIVILPTIIVTQAVNLLWLKTRREGKNFLCRSMELDI
jgi:hypothetical protein